MSGVYSHLITCNDFDILVSVIFLEMFMSFANTRISAFKTPVTALSICFSASPDRHPSHPTELNIQLLPNRSLGGGRCMWKLSP